jgi:SWI/SNF-related matrix-associated actin-dependent regulator 1 of chromatin subfamily A
MSLFPFQGEGIASALEHNAALLADEMGLGKTVQAIGVINADPTISRVIVVCPASMRIPWSRELEKWLERPLSIGVIGVDSASSDKLIKESQILVINYDRLSRHAKELSAITFDLAVLDECHFAKSLDAQRTKAALSLQARRRMALSGTPMLNRPIELLPVLSWLSPLGWPLDGWYDYARRYCGAYFNGFGWDASGASNLAELQERLRSTVMIRRTKAEVLPQLPPKLRQVIELVPSNGMEPLLVRELEAFERSAPRLRIDKAGIDWDNLSKVRHETALAKAPLVAAFVEDIVSSTNEKVVIFAHHRDVIAFLAEALGWCCPVILAGGMSPKEKQASIDRFQTLPAVRIFVGNIQAAGTGITLAPASSRCIFAELSWTPAEMTQCEDRLHRIGTKDSVHVQHLVLEGSLDAMMVKVLIKKQQILDAVLETI